jgi:hypothetical protein
VAIVSKRIFRSSASAALCSLCGIASLEDIFDIPAGPESVDLACFFGLVAVMLLLHAGGNR